MSVLKDEWAVGRYGEAAADGPELTLQAHLDRAAERALRGVRKAQIKLAAYYLFHADVAAAREIYRDMAEEQAARLISIREELLAVESPYFWEITDRGTNFDWMPPECRSRVLEFFSWFGEMLPPHVTTPPSGAPTFRRD